MFVAILHILTWFLLTELVKSSLLCACAKHNVYIHKEPDQNLTTVIDTLLSGNCVIHIYSNNLWVKVMTDKNQVGYTRAVDVTIRDCKHVQETGYRESRFVKSSNTNCSTKHSLNSVCNYDTSFIVNGNWNDWATWSQCSVTCGNGIRFRFRLCENPKPLNGGLECVGDKLQEHQCATNKCPVNGNWNNWTPWEQCSTTCGTGTRFRYRLCENPKPSNGGLDCVGYKLQEQQCATNFCPTSTPRPTNVILSTKPSSTVQTCDKLGLVHALGSNLKITHTLANICPDGSTASPESVAMELCGLQRSSTWRKGMSVLDACNQQILTSKFVPVASYQGSIMDQYSGVFVGCEPGGFEIAMQLCGHPISIYHVTDTASGSPFNPNNYHIIIKKMLPSTISNVPTPCFLVDVDKVKRNAQNMIDRCKRLGIQLRPHMKTNKTIEGGEILTAGTRRTIEVSTLDEAEFYANAGFEDILYGFPIIEAKVDRCKQLAEKLEEFHLMLESFESFNALESNPPNNGKKWSVYIEVDAGYNRTGVRWDSEDAMNLIQMVLKSKNVKLKGIYTHDGNSYNCTGEHEIKQVAKLANERLLDLVQRVLKETGTQVNVCQGSTPSLSCPDDSLSNLKECTPGNYVFYDFMQTRIGSCVLGDVACRVATRVICHKPELNMICIDCGFLGLSQDGLLSNLPGGPCLFQDNPNLKLIGMTQEIGKVTSTEGKLDCSKYPIGSLLFIYPNHSCATAAMHPIYYVHSGDKIVTTWKPTRGW